MREVVARVYQFVGRQGIGFSPEIETVKLLLLESELAESPGDWLLA